jgi:hypothetical protein
VGSSGLADTLSTTLFRVKALEANHAAIVLALVLKSTPVVVNVTSELAVVHAPEPLWHVDNAKLAALAPVDLLAIASVVIHP